VPVTLAAYALITEDEYKEQGSGIDASDPTQDDAIRWCINSASERIMEYGGREWKDLGLGSARTFQITPGGCYFDEVSFGANDAQTISSVVIDTQLGATGLTLTTTQYQPVPVQKWHGVFTGIHILSGAVGYIPLGARRQATVTGTWGWVSVPADIKHACSETVHEWLAGSYQVNGGQDTLGFVSSQQLQLPARVRSTLDPLSQVLLA
jgi:ribosomal protein S6E (S10)